jgi:rRNA-processing protein FCF1
MHIKDLTTDELKSLIRETVMETLEELLPDPDEGKIVNAELRQELLEIRKRREKGERSIPSADVMHRLGLGG